MLSSNTNNFFLGYYKYIVMERVNPSGVTYSSGAIPLATPAKSSIRKFYPSNGRDFEYDKVNIIQLPLAAEGQFLDAASHSFLKFDMVFKSDKSSAGSMRMGGGGAHCWIDRLRILSATGQQLEDIQDYNVLHSMLTDMTCSSDHISTVLATRSGASARLQGKGESRASIITHGGPTADGGRNTTVTIAGTTVTAQAAIFTSNIFVGKVFHLNGESKVITAVPTTSTLTVASSMSAVTTPNAGWRIYDASKVPAEHDDYGMEEITLSTNASEVTRTYCINPVSGLLMQPKYIPLLMTKGGIQLEFVLADPKVAMVTDGSSLVPSYTLKNVEYIAELIDFGPEFNSNFIQMMAGVGGALMSGVTYRSHVSTLKKEGRSVDISERARSIKSIFTMLRHQDDLQTKSCESLRNRRCPAKLTGYQYRVGSVTYPDHFVRVQAPYPTRAGLQAEGTGDQDKLNCSESFSQALKALGNALTDVRHGSLVTPENWLQNKRNSTYTEADASSGVQGVSKIPGTFVMACSFESFAKDSSKLESGLNSAAQSLPVELQLQAGADLGNGSSGSDGDGSDYRVNAYVCCDAMFNFLPNGDVISSI